MYAVWVYFDLSVDFVCLGEGVVRELGQAEVWCGCSESLYVFSDFYLEVVSLGYRVWSWFCLMVIYDFARVGCDFCVSVVGFFGDEGVCE